MRGWRATGRPTPRTSGCRRTARRSRGTFSDEVRDRQHHLPGHRRDRGGVASLLRARQRAEADHLGAAGDRAVAAGAARHQPAPALGPAVAAAVAGAVAGAGAGAVAVAVAVAVSADAEGRAATQRNVARSPRGSDGGRKLRVSRRNPPLSPAATGFATFLGGCGGRAPAAGGRGGRGARPPGGSGGSRGRVRGSRGRPRAAPRPAPPRAVPPAGRAAPRPPAGPPRSP